MNRAMRVRVSGPLAPYADGFRTVLAERGYTPSSPRRNAHSHATPLKTTPGRYRPPDALLTFLEAL